MAKIKEIKFTDSELAKLQEVQQGYQDMQVKMGGFKMQQIGHDRAGDRLAELEETLMTELQELNDNENSVAQELNDKYGPGSLNPETGVFTPAPQPEEPAEA